MAESSRHVVQRVAIGRRRRTDWVLVIARLLLLVKTIPSPLVTLGGRMVTRRVVAIGVRMAMIRLMMMAAVKVRRSSAAGRIRLLVMTDEVHWFVFNGRCRRRRRFAMIARQISRLAVRRRALRRDNGGLSIEPQWIGRYYKTSSRRKLNHLLDSATTTATTTTTKMYTATTPRFYWLGFG